MTVLRGDVFFANLSPVIGSEQGGLRPVLILQNDVGNAYSPTTIVAAVTSRIKRAKLPTHVELPAPRYHLERDSVILLEQVRTIDKQRLREKIAHLDEEAMARVDHALGISVGLLLLE